MEITELIMLYGKPTIKQELKNINNSIGPYFSQNFSRYIYDKPIDKWVFKDKRLMIHFGSVY